MRLNPTSQVHTLLGVVMLSKSRLQESNLLT